MDTRNIVVGGILIAVIVLLGIITFAPNNQNGGILNVNNNVPPTVSPARTVTINLQDQNNSSQSGTAILTQEDSSILVTLNLINSPENTPQPAHIHIGACPEPGAIKYPLNNVVNGRSETRLNITFEELEQQLPAAINVHKSVDEIDVYVACGNVEL